jgi:hypothetical protein
MVSEKDRLRSAIESRLKGLRSILDQVDGEQLSTEQALTMLDELSDIQAEMPDIAAAVDRLA